MVFTFSGLDTQWPYCVQRKDDKVMQSEEKASLEEYLKVESLFLTHKFTSCSALILVLE